MQQNSARRASIALGVFMAVILIGGSILPLLTQNSTTTAPVVDPTDVPTPTFPPPVTDFTAISFDGLYLHPSGLYTIALPSGFIVTQPDTNATFAQVNMNNSDTLGVIDAYVERPFTPITTEGLSDHFSQAALEPTWGRFSSWEETGRRMEGDRLLIDFSVDFRNQPYAARQTAWTDGERIYAVRVLAPANAINYLRYLLDNLPNTFTPLNLFPGTPFDWLVTYDNITNAVVRHPADWTQTDGGAGRPTTITSADGASLRTEARAGVTVTDEAAARAWVEAAQPGAQVLSVVPVTRGAASGFSVGYSYQTFDGDAMSALVVLLNQTDSAGGTPTLLVANLRFPGTGVDVNAVDPTIPDAFAPPIEPTDASPLLPGASDAFSAPGTTTTSDPRLPVLAAVMNTFQAVAPINLAASALQPTPTPLPTITPTPLPVTPTAVVETTPEATADAEMTPDADMTAEATPDVEMTAEAEATPEATAAA
ncbi:MAG: hypothetical protein SGI73_14185 [Chloroflexota bacterium]|nr:hypothetical protein [Chloroflexota bacterium]